MKRSMLFWHLCDMKIFISVHIDAKKLLKIFALSQKSDTRLPLTKKGGISGTFFIETLFT